MNKLLKSSTFLFLFLIAFLPLTTFAQAIPYSPNNLADSFTPMPTDLSIGYLGQVFGTVGTVLHGTSGQLLGQLFKIFNIGLLVLAGVFVIYTITMTVIHAAHEGGFMSQRWNSAWIAIRTVFGIGLLVPSATTGYSTIQVIVMWVVIQGVGFANMAWSNALSYVAQAGALYTPPATDTATMIDLVGTILEMQTCMYYAQNVEQVAQQNLKEQQQKQQVASTTNTATPTPITNEITNFTPLFTVYYDSKANVYNSVVKFPGNGYAEDGQQDNACGQISFGTNSDQGALQQDNKVSTLKAAVRQIIMDTSNYATQMVGTGTTPPSNMGNFATQIQGAIVGGAADWVNITLPIRTGGLDSTDQMMTDFMQLANQQGWIMAGSFYYGLGHVQSKVTAATSVSVNIDQAPAGMLTPSAGAYISFSNMPQVAVGNMTNLQNFTEANKETLANLMGTQGVGAYVESARGLAGQVDQTSKITINIGEAGILSFLLNPVAAIMTSIIMALQTSTGDPLLILQNIGNSLIGLSALMWLGATVGIFGTALGTSLLSSVQSAGYATLDAVIAFVPAFTIFVLIFYVMGANFAYYVPLIPYIIFVFTAVGWLITVIEAMAAAPLVALGITHPEGHDLLGKSDQAMMMLVSVFLRPILMVIGLFAGIIVSRVVLRFLNQGFFGIVLDVGDFNLFAIVGVLIIYSMLLVSIVNQAFSLIYVVPDRVMRWIGVHEQGVSPAQEALQASKGGFEQITGGTQQMGGQVSGSFIGRRASAIKKKESGEITGSGGNS